MSPTDSVLIPFPETNVIGYVTEIVENEDSGLVRRFRFLVLEPSSYGTRAGRIGSQTACSLYDRSSWPTAGSCLSTIASSARAVPMRTSRGPSRQRPRTRRTVSGKGPFPSPHGVPRCSPDPIFPIQPPGCALPERPPWGGIGPWAWPHRELNAPWSSLCGQCTRSQGVNLPWLEPHTTAAAVALLVWFQRRPPPDDRRREYRAIADKIAAAQHITVVGGGPTGCEMVAEIRERHPSKKARERAAVRSGKL